MADYDEEANAERALADDASWKVMQKNTFTRWVNEHLKHSGKQITELQTDFCDGLKLIALIEVLSGKQMRGVNKRPNFRTQKLENVTLVLRFLEHDEGIRIVNIDSTHIVDGNLKLILGLIWLLILHYQISKPVWHDEEPRTPGPQGETEKGPTPKQRLNGWLANKLPPAAADFSNLTKDWQSGVRLGALVESCAPGLCPDWASWDPKKGLENTREAMDLAEKWLDVPQLITPAEMCSPNVDEKSVMTYLSQYPSCQLKQGAPLRPRTDPSRVRAYGPGLEQSGNVVGAQARFTVDASTAGRGELEVLVQTASGAHEKCEVVATNEERSTFSCCYEPSQEGEYRVTIRWGNAQVNGEVPKSPFRVTVQGAPGDASKCVATGPGLSAAEVGKRTWFEVVTRGAGSGMLDVTIVDSRGSRDSAKPRITKKSDDAYLVEYAPTVDGALKVEVLFAGAHVPNSPFIVHAARAVDPSRVYVTGRGVQPRGVRVGDTADLTVHYEQTGPADCSVEVVALGSNLSVPTTVRRDASLQQAVCSYVPPCPGDYEVRVLYAGRHVRKSPFRVQVGRKLDTLLRTFGPGLFAGANNQPVIFCVAMNGDGHALGFTVEGPSQARIECADHERGAADIKFYPSAPGEYAIRVLADDDDVPNSPFMCNVHDTQPALELAAVRVSGDGVTHRGRAFVNQAASFLVDLRAAPKRASVRASQIDSPQRASTLSRGSSGRPDILVFEATTGLPVEVLVDDKQPDTYSCRYVPKSTGWHVVFVTVADVNAPGSPFWVQVEESTSPQNVRVSGSGVQRALRNQQAEFLVDCSKAGDGELQVRILDEAGRDVPFELKEAGGETENVALVTYTPKTVGTYHVKVDYAKTSVPGAPFSVNVLPDIDVSAIRIENFADAGGNEQRAYLASVNDFNVNARAIDARGVGKLVAVMTTPSGKRIACPVTNRADGTYNVVYTPLEEGAHRFALTFDGLDVPAAHALLLQGVAGSDASLVRVTGSGVLGGFTNEPHTFSVDTRRAGRGDLAVYIEGPSEAKMTLNDHKDGTCAVEWCPTKPGNYAVQVKFADHDVPGSPFTACVRDKVDPRRVLLSGAPVDGSVPLRAKKPAKFQIDARNAGRAQLEVAYGEAAGNAVGKPINERPADVRTHGDGLFEAVCYPDAPGDYDVAVTYDGAHVAGSPFRMHVRPAFEPEKVHVELAPKCASSLPVRALIDTRDAGEADLSALAQFAGPAPQHASAQPADQPHTVRSTLDALPDGRVACEFVPHEAGSYQLAVHFGGQPAGRSPYSTVAEPVGDASKCKFESPLGGEVKLFETNSFTVDCAQAGPRGAAALTVRIVQPDGTELTDVQTVANDDGTFTVSYRPKQEGPHRVDVRYGGVTVPGGRVEQTAVPAEKWTDAPTIGGFYKQAFALQLGDEPDADLLKHVTVTIRTPSGSTVNADKVEQVGPNAIVISYRPREVGMHEAHVAYRGQPVAGTPIYFYADAVASGRVTAHGGGLSYGRVGEPAEFYLVTRESGPGNVGVAVEGPSKCDVLSEDVPGGLRVWYVPGAPGDYRITVRFNGEPISGSPYTAHIVGDSSVRAKAVLGGSTEFALSVSEADIANLTATVTTPSGIELPCTLKRLSGGVLGVSFFAKEIGDHKVSIFRSGKHIHGSPFTINVRAEHIGDASRVRCSGEGLSRAYANHPNTFTVDSTKAGYGGLSFAVEGPGRTELECADAEDGTTLVTYTPDEPGAYKIHVEYAETPVPGSPFQVQVLPASQAGSAPLRPRGASSLKRSDSDSRRTRMSQLIIPESIASQSGLPSSPGAIPLLLRPVSFVVNYGAPPNGSKLRAVVESPNGIEDEASVTQLDRAQSLVRFAPRQRGVHLVSVLVTSDDQHEQHSSDCTHGADVHIAGSPFRVVVGAEEADPGMVHAVGDGLRHGVVGSRCAFLVNTLNAGGGSLSVAIDGPSKVTIKCEETHDGYEFAYVPLAPGLYTITIKFAGNFQIVGSPFRAEIVPAGPGGAQAQPVTSTELESASCVVECAPKSLASAPSGAAADRLANAEAASQADSQKVACEGLGLKLAIAGRPAQFSVDARACGSLNLLLVGMLAMSDGANAQPCSELIVRHTETQQYNVSYLVRERGQYVLVVKWGNQHVPGSPFLVDVV